jgi:hypothetical protein
VRPDRFFGFSDVSTLGETVKMAILERALVDALDRPSYAGGLGEVSRMVARAATRISWDGLFEVLVFHPLRGPRRMKRAFLSSYPWRQIGATLPDETTTGASIGAGIGTEVGLALVPRARFLVGPKAPRAPFTVATGRFRPRSTALRLR